MLTVSQLRAARAMIGLSVEELSSASGLSVEILTTAETAGDHAEPGVTEQLRTFFESRGIIFLAAGDGEPNAGAGVRLRQKSSDEGIRPQNLNAANDD